MWVCYCCGLTLVWRFVSTIISIIISGNLEMHFLNILIICSRCSHTIFSGQRTGLSLPSSVQTNTNQSQILHTTKCQNRPRSMCRPRWMDTGLFSLITQQSLHDHCGRGYTSHPPNEECHHTRWRYYHWKMQGCYPIGDAGCRCRCGIVRWCTECRC